MELQWQLRWQLRPPFGTEPKQPNPSRIQAQPVQKPAPEKVPNVAFGRPNNASQGAAKPGQKYASVGLNSKVPRAPFVMHAKQRHPSRIQTSFSNAL